MKRQSHSSRGAALLAAMLTVSLVAMLAAGAAWQQWRSVKVESTERQHAQAQWLLLGALDWARIILREDARSGNPDAPTDHLAEPWAIPLQEARLSTFLAANSNSSAGNKSVTNGSSTFSNTFSKDALTQEAYLSGQIIDLQARMNVGNILQGNQIDLKSLQAFERLFEALSLPTAQLNTLAQGLVAAQQQKDGAPLMPQRVSQLTWLGLTPQTLNSLAPYITVLPTRNRWTTTPCNWASSMMLSKRSSSLPINKCSQASRSARRFMSAPIARNIDKPPSCPWGKTARVTWASTAWSSGVSVYQ